MSAPTFEQDVSTQRTYDQAKHGFAIQLMGRVKWTTLKGAFYFDNGQYPSKARAFDAALVRLQQLHAGIGAGVRRSGMRTYRVVAL